MRFLLSCIFICSLFLITPSYGYSQQLYSIPKQSIEPFKLLGKLTSFNYYSSELPDINLVLEMPPFEISDFVTYGEYKGYLAAIKKDSSAKFYSAQLPDTSMCLPSVYQEYTAGNKFDLYPVLGISWEAAMNYCRWMTIKNNRDSVKFIYRLPKESEWLAVYTYLLNNSIQKDLNKEYSDWLLNAFDDNRWTSVKTDNHVHRGNFDYIYIGEPKDPNVLKRKMVIGNSYLFNMETLADYCLIYYYKYHGYRQVGFRVLRTPVEDSNFVDNTGIEQKSIDRQLIKSWGLKREGT